MVQYRTAERILARDKRVFVGVDVHKESWHVSALIEGEVVFRGGIPADYGGLRDLVSRFRDCEVRVAYEAGPCGFSLHDRLEGDGVRCLVTPPSLVPMESGNRVKTDRRDSLKLARLLEAGMLKEVFVLSEAERSHRDLVRTRRQLVQHRGDVIRQVKAKLLFHSLRPNHRGGASWSRRYAALVRAVPYPTEVLHRAIDALLGVCEYLTEQIRAVSREILSLARTDRYRARVELLRTIPGIGVLTAMEILTELGDLSRFGSNEELASFLGLTPSEYSSGESIRQGRITHCGNTRLRSSLVECSWVLVRRDPAMRRKFDRIKRVRGAKRAIVAVARTLSACIRHVLLTGERYIVGHEAAKDAANQ